jgi:hypothetical protein
MLIAKETFDRDVPRHTVSFSVGETVQVKSLRKIGRIVGMENGQWLVRLIEGDAPISCDSGNLERRQALMG